jgi:MtN3 and saliva related transmembrane protein
MDLLTTAIGFIAAAFTTACYLPQLYKSWKTRSTGDLSFVMLAALAAGCSLWTLYGMLRSDVVLTAANVVSLTFVLGILFFKFSDPARAMSGKARPGPRSGMDAGFPSDIAKNQGN